MSKDALIKVKDNTRTERDIFTDSAGNLPVNLGTTIAGEDITNDVLKTENRFTLQEINTGVGTLVKTGAGFLHRININNAGSSWEIDVYDGTSSSGTSIAKIRGATTIVSPEYNGTFSTGLFIDTVKGTTVGDLTVSYR